MQLGAKLYRACEDRGLISTDATADASNPAYRGVTPVMELPSVEEWNFWIGHA